MAIAAEIVPAKPPHVPGRVWYFIAALIFLAGLAAMLTLMVEQLSGIGSRMIQVIVPGQSELTLDKAGTYTIFHEYRSTVGTRVFAVETVSGLSVTVRSKATGEDILLQTTTGASYTVEGRSGRSILNFKITEPGTYLLIAGYSDGRREPQTVITVDRGFVGSILLTVGAAFALLFGGLAGAGGLVIFVAIKRHKAKQAGILP